MKGKHGFCGLWALVLLGFLFSQSALAGRLDEFEEDAKKRERKTQRDDTPSSDDRRPEKDDGRRHRQPRAIYYPDARYPEHRYPGDIYDSPRRPAPRFDDGLNFNPFAPFVYGSMISMTRAAALGISGQQIPVYGRTTTTGKQWGEFIIPFVQLDITQGELESEIDAKNFRIELGYGPFAVMHKQLSLREESTEDTLKAKQTLFLLRMSVSEQIQFHLGAGEYTLEGNTEDAETAYTAGANLHFRNGFGIEYRPVWVNGGALELEEHELSLLYGKRFWAGKIGYRWLISEHESLAGPFAGMSIAF